MNRISKYLLLILCGCEINTPPLPPIDKPSFSYEELMYQQRQLEEEIKKTSPKL